MLVLYRTRIIKVTDRFRRIVIFATIGIMVFYGVCFLIRLFAGADSVSFLASPSLLGIGFSVFVAGIAAMNLALDFDFIERGVEDGADEGLRVVRARSACWSRSSGCTSRSCGCCPSSASR